MTDLATTHLASIDQAKPGLAIADLKTWPAQQWRRNRGLALAFWFNAALLAVSLAALPFDQRRILGLSPWIKPIKFELSIVIYAVTIAVLLDLLDSGSAGKSRRMRSIIGWGVGVAMIGEIAVIVMQSVRGVPSHMNYSTPFNGAAFGLMGLLIIENTVMVGLLLALYCRKLEHLQPALKWGVRLGLLALLAGSVEGVLIVAHGGHTVGAHDGGAGLPFVNWSVAHGDLRVPHFFALHALQLLPLAGLALSRTRLRPTTQVAAVVAFAGVYLGAVWWLFRQAMAGRPLLG